MRASRLVLLPLALVMSCGGDELPTTATRSHLVQTPEGYWQDLHGKDHALGLRPELADAANAAAKKAGTLHDAPIVAASGLTAAYDGCAAIGGCTPVRNQGNCGSCWAFATTGAFEQSVSHTYGSVDFAEQHLLDCNTMKYDCGGGWFAFGDLKNGDALESCDPYLAVAKTCNASCALSNSVASWSYIAKSNTIPTTDAIKTAILSYGPVAAAVFVNKAFQLYAGGVFSGKAAKGQINHAIVLTGWDDAKGAWRLRNSWGTAWGEGGYMWIKYGSMNVGYGAAYVLAGPSL